MSEFAFFRFLSSNLLSAEERQHKAEIVDLTEEVLQAHGLESDSKISKLSEDTVKDIPAEMRKLRKKKRRGDDQSGDIEKADLDGEEEASVSESSIQ